MVDQDQQDMEDTYGPRALHSEHQIGDHIHYRYEGEPTSGKILWVCAARPAENLHLVYIVVNDTAEGIPHVVFPSDVLTA